MPTFSFLILTYNSSRHIGNLLKSLFEKYSEKIEKEEYEIVIVDNNSQDDTVEIIEKNYSRKIKLVKNNNNSGFANGINLGVSYTKSQYVLFLNPDAEILHGDVENIISIFKKDEKIAAVGAKILNWNGKNELSAGKFYSFANTILLTLGLEDIFHVRFSPDKEEEVAFVSGGCMCVRKEIFEKIGGFDKNFFMYIEDMEFCYRLKKEGYIVCFSPNFTIRHLGQGSSDRSFAIVNIYKGLLFFHKKHSSILVFKSIYFFLKLKAFVLVILGKLINNKNITRTYLQALKV